MELEMPFSVCPQPDAERDVCSASPRGFGPRLPPRGVGQSSNTAGAISLKRDLHGSFSWGGGKEERKQVWIVFTFPFLN